MEMRPEEDKERAETRNLPHDGPGWLGARKAREGNLARWERGNWAGGGHTASQAVTSGLLCLCANFSQSRSSTSPAAHGSKGGAALTSGGSGRCDQR